MNILQKRFIIPVAAGMVALTTLCSVSAWAQSSASGSVGGQVTDQQGSAVPEVDIRLTDLSTNFTLKTLSNATGRFVYVNVNPGTYTVTFVKTGFSTRKVEGQEVRVGELLNLNTTLEVGAVTNVIEVTSSQGAELQTVNSTIGTTVSGASLTYLPIFGSDSSSLALYQPGVTKEGAVAGAMYDQNTFQSGRR